MVVGELVVVLIVVGDADVVAAVVVVDVTGVVIEDVSVECFSLLSST